MLINRFLVMPFMVQSTPLVLIKNFEVRCDAQPDRGGEPDRDKGGDEAEEDFHRLRLPLDYALEIAAYLTPPHHAGGFLADEAGATCYFCPTVSFFTALDADAFPDMS